MVPEGAAHLHAKGQRAPAHCQPPALPEEIHAAHRQRQIRVCFSFSQEVSRKPQKKCEHLALDDIKESISDLRWYRKHIFKNK